MVPPMPRTRRSPFWLLLPGLLLACSGVPDFEAALDAPFPARERQFAAQAGAAAAPAARPPATRREDVTDDYHGVPIADPYRWLEDQDGAEVQAFVAAQNEFARAHLDAAPGREGLRERLAGLWNFERFDAPVKKGARWFWWKNDGLQNQSVLYVADRPDGDGEALLDPNALSQDGTLAISGLAISDDGARIAYGESKSGSDWRTWRVLDVAQKRTLPDSVPWSKFSGAAWTKDGQGFFYQRYPAPGEGATYEQPNLQPQLCYHKLGQASGEDRVVYERPDEPKWGFQPTVTDDGRFLLITVSQGTDRRRRLMIADLEDEGLQVRPLWADLEASWSFLGNEGDTFYFLSDYEAPRSRIVALERTDARGSLRTVVPEQECKLQSAQWQRGRFLCNCLKDASSELRLFAADGERLPSPTGLGIGTASGFAGGPQDELAHFVFASFTAPPAVMQLDLAAGTLRTLRRPAFRGDGDGLVTRRVFLQSKDGTRLCLFLTHKKGLRLSGDAPTLLYGYGGFNIPITPSFRVPNFVFCEQGGVYAQAVLRGGGEYGEDWHQAGMLQQKQNVFDDFMACAEYLTRNGYTSPRRLAIQGGSNGGLLVGACLLQRPDLFGAAIPEVGVLDMLRYHRFTIGWAWAPEYGTSDDPAQFETLLRYSPLHNIEAGRAYPPTLIMTGDHDDRVLPGHSYKFAATLQAAQGGCAPILLRVATKAGHGAGKPVAKQIDEAVDRLAFLAMTIGKP